MEIASCSLCVLGWVLAIVGELVILTAAYRRGPVLFVACLVIPFAPYGFAVAHLRKLWLPLALALTGCAILVLGLHLSPCGGDHG